MAGLRGKPAFPRVHRRQGAPGTWLLTEGPRRTFAGDAGDVSDLMRGSKAGVRSGSVGWVDGLNGKALSFPGTAGNGVTFTAPVSTNALTLSAWVYATAVSGFAPVLVCRDSGLVSLALSG